MLSGSVRYSTDLSEDSEAASEAMSDASEEMVRVAAEVLPERCSRTYSESEDEVAAVTETSVEERIGNTGWYVTGEV